MKRKVIVSILIIVMILALALSAAAYFMLQARMGLFSGRVEYVGQQPGAGDPQLVLRVEDEDIGQSGDLSTGKGAKPAAKAAEAAEKSGKPAAGQSGSDK